MTFAPALVKRLARAALATRSLGFLAASAVITLALAGCAAPGDPTPPHPVIPTAITDLSARQAGNSVALDFTLPTRSTDREALAEMPEVEVDRAALPPGTATAPDTAWHQIYTVPAARVDTYVTGGRFDFRDPLSVDVLGRAPGSVLAYRVRTRVSKRRVSADSNVVSVAIYPAPPAPEDLRASVTEPAIVLSWSEPPSQAPVAGYRVYRAESKPGEAGSAPPSGAALDAELRLVGTVTTPEFRDTQFAFGQTYLYVVRAIAQYESSAVESDDSSSVTVEARDTFPPASPTGLEAAIVPATEQGPAYVELSWAISSESYLAGYRVYRSENAENNGEQVNGELLPTPAFRDDAVKAGGHYFYRVSAVDQAGNESALSGPIGVDLPQTAP